MKKELAVGKFKPGNLTDLNLIRPRNRQKPLNNVHAGQLLLLLLLRSHLTC